MSGLSLAGWQFVVDGLDTEVDCGGSTHRIAWRRGKLVLRDHDLTAEQVGVALGGHAPRCMQVMQAWRRARRHARFVKVDDETISYFRAKGLSLGEQFQAALLPEPLRELRERTTWLHALRAGDDLRKRSRNTLTKAVRREAERVLDRVVQPARAWTEVVPSAQVLSRGAPPRAIARPGGGDIQIAEVFLPPEWLVTVALPGMAEIDGRFVLSLEAARTGELAARLLDWRRTPTGRLTAHVARARVERVDGAWRTNLRQ